LKTTCKSGCKSRGGRVGPASKRKKGV